MKKLIIGLIILSATPFLIILGNYVIKYFQSNENVTIFACIMGGIAVCFNFIIACLLVIKGHQEVGSFKGWGDEIEKL